MLRGRLISNYGTVFLCVVFYAFGGLAFEAIQLWRCR